MRRAGWLLLLALTGCGGKAEPAPTDTGAKAAAQAFYDAVVSRDANSAHDLLDAESRRRISRDAFAQLLASYHRNLGFTPERAILRSCDEQGDSAIIHLNLVGKGGGHSRRYQDGITLHRTNGEWRIVLPVNFGRIR